MDRVDLEISTRFGLLPYVDLLKELQGPERAPRRRMLPPAPDRRPPQLRLRKRLSKPCPCGHHQWTIVRNHDRYRDPFLQCQGCESSFRMNRTPLDIQFAWRDGIPMPDEVINRAHHTDARKD